MPVEDKTQSLVFFVRTAAVLCDGLSHILFRCLHGVSAMSTIIIHRVREVLLVETLVFDSVSSPSERV